MTEPKKILLVFLIVMAIGLVALAVERVLEIAGRWWIMLASVSLAVLILLLGVHFAIASDYGQWDRSDPIVKWYQELMQPVEIGTRILVPNHKLKYDKSNPTGHGVIFLSASGFVYCYVTPGGS